MTASSCTWVTARPRWPCSRNGSSPDHDRLEVHHQVATDQVVADPRQQEQPRRLDGPAGHHHVAGVHRPLDAVGPDEVDPGGPPPGRLDARDEGLGAQLGPARRHHPLQQGDRDPPWRGSGTRRTRRTRSCCRPGGRRRARCWRPSGAVVGVEPEPLGRRARQGGGVHRGARRHRVRARAPGGEGIGTGRPRPPRSTAPPRRSRARGRRRPPASRRPRRPGCGPRAENSRKSSSPKRGTLPSAWVPPPPTVEGMEFTSPTCVWSPSSAERRKVRGSRKGSGPRKCRKTNLISSLE